MTKHPHAENMALYAQDALETDKPWERWEVEYPACIWTPLDNHPEWNSHAKYRRKPRTITINGYEVPEPVREPLDVGDHYWTFSPFTSTGVYRSTWHNFDVDRCAMINGFIHLTEEAALAHAEALLSFTKKDTSK